MAFGILRPSPQVRQHALDLLEGVPQVFGDLLGDHVRVGGFAESSRSSSRRPGAGRCSDLSHDLKHRDP
jgi:hypothetical protein